MKIVKYFWLYIVFILSIIAIISALIAEYLFDILPCKMCIYQRYPYYFIIFISAIFLIFKKLSSIWYFWITELLFTIGVFFAIWHVGIEQKLLPGLSSCTNIIKKTESLTNLKNQILNQNIISCDEISWSFFGFSAASLNSILLICLLLFNTIFLIQKKYEKEKNI